MSKYPVIGRMLSSPVKAVKGMRYGVEIEVEGEDLPVFDYSTTHSILSKWKTTYDGSLRGESKEYVSRKPYLMNTTRGMVATLADYLSTCELNISDRCGVHVHTNVQDMQINHLYNFLVLYFLIEEPLIDWCGPARVANVFCMRGKDASGNIDYIRDSMDDLHLIVNADSSVCKYGALNLSSIPIFGSLEFRGLATPPDTDDWWRIRRIVGVMNHLKTTAMQYDSPKEIYNAWIRSSPTEFFKSVYYPMHPMFIPSEQVLRRGFSLIQELFHEYEEKRMKYLCKAYF